MIRYFHHPEEETSCELLCRVVFSAWLTRPRLSAGPTLPLRVSRFVKVVVALECARSSIGVWYSCVFGETGAQQLTCESVLWTAPAFPRPKRSSPSSELAGGGDSSILRGFTLTLLLHHSPNGIGEPEDEGDK
jgi:hypothetical protein